MEVIEAAGYQVHHIFARKEVDRTRRKKRFWPDAPGVKGCTIHSFKGWETPALVMGIERREASRRLAYVVHDPHPRRRHRQAGVPVGGQQ